MKNQSLLSGKIRKVLPICRLLKRVVKVKIYISYGSHLTFTDSSIYIYILKTKRNLSGCIIEQFCFDFD